MLLTEEQRVAVQNDGNTLLVACPGSGKTRAIVAKLLRCVTQVRDTPRRVACITYTNAAVSEIEQRLRVYGRTGDENYCDVSTIHTFCLQQILRNFYWRLPQYSRGFVVASPDSEAYRGAVNGVCADYGLPLTAADSFELLNRQPDGAPIVREPLAYSDDVDRPFRLDVNNDSGRCR